MERPAPKAGVTGAALTTVVSVLIHRCECRQRGGAGDDRRPAGGGRGAAPQHALHLQAKPGARSSMTFNVPQMLALFAICTRDVARR